MRQLKAFMKAKKRGRCKCLTLNMWRCGEFCGCVNECGDVNPTPPVPGFTYTFNKTSTRGRTDLYTAEKFVTGEDVPVGSYTLSVKYDTNDEGFDTVKIGDGTDWREVPEMVLDGQDDIMRNSYVANAEATLTEGTQEAFKAVYEDYEGFMTDDTEHLYFGVYSVEGERKNVSVGVANSEYEYGNEGYDIVFYLESDGTICQNYGCDAGYVITDEQGQAIYDIIASENFKGTQEDYKRLYQAAEDLYHTFWLEYGILSASDGYVVYRYEPYETHDPAEEYHFNYRLDGEMVVYSWSISNGTTERTFPWSGTFGNTLKSKSDIAYAAGTQEAYGQLFNSYKEAYTNNGSSLYDIYYNEASVISGETYKLYNYRWYTSGSTENAFLIFNVNGQGELTEAYTLDYSDSEATKIPVNFETAEALISQTEQTIATGTQAAYEETVEYAIDLLNSLIG